MLGQVIVFILHNVLLIIALFLFGIFGLRRNLSIDGFNDIEVKRTQLRKEMFLLKLLQSVFLLLCFCC